MFKRIKALALIGLCLAMAMTAFAGCGGGRPQIDWDIDPSTSKIPLRVLYPQSGMSDTAFQNSYTAELTQRLTGYEITYSQLASSAEEQEVSTLIQGREKFNIMKLSSGSYKAFVTQDSFLDLTELLERYGQDLLATMTPESKESVTYEGKIYAIPETSFSAMQDNALVFNKAHLQEAGITAIPETLGEFTTALQKLQAHFSSNSNYRAFGLPGTLSDCSTISSCFDMPYEFYAENNQVKNFIYSDAFENYVRYMNKLVNNNYIANSWSSKLGTDVLSDFTNGLVSVAYIPYWHVSPLASLMHKNNPQYSTIEEARANLEWRVRIKGDGTDNSKVQTQGKYRSDIGNAYYLSIPFYMAEEAVYAIHWMNEKIKEQNFLKFLIGEEGVTYTVTTADDPDAVEVNYNGEAHYFKLTALFEEHIVGNSMYATGTNGAMSAAYWPMREAGFKAWNVLMPKDETCIGNVLSMTPLFPNWSPKEIVARSSIVTNVQLIISASGTGKDKIDDRLASARNLFESQYWSKCSAEINAWYASKQA